MTGSGTQKVWCDLSSGHERARCFHLGNSGFKAASLIAAKAAHWLVVGGQCFPVARGSMTTERLSSLITVP